MFYAGPIRSKRNDGIESTNAWQTFPASRKNARAR
jgi:hypothetical protein